MRASFAIVVGIALIACLGGCAPTLPEYNDGLRAYAAGRLDVAARTMQPLQKATDDMNYPIYMLDLAYAEEWLGDLTAAEKFYLTGLAAFDQKLSTGGKAAQVIIPAPGTFYRGDQFEHVFEHYFLGRVYFRRGEWNDARIEFSKAQEMNLSSDANGGHDSSIIDFMAAQTYLKLDDPNNAQVSLRNVVKFQPAFPYSYLELCRVAQHYGDFSAAENYYREYAQRDRNPVKIPYDDKDSHDGLLVAVIDLGDGPYRTGDVSNEKVPAHYPERRAAIGVSGRMFVASKVDEIFLHAQHEAGTASHTAKQVGLVAARTALEILAAKETGVFVDVPENDVRRVDMMPGEFHVVEIPLAPGQYSGSLFVETAAGATMGLHPTGAFRIAAGQKTFIFLRGWSGWHRPGAANPRGPIILPVGRP